MIYTVVLIIFQQYLLLYNVQHSIFIIKQSFNQYMNIYDIDINLTQTGKNLTSIKILHDFFF